MKKADNIYYINGTAYAGKSTLVKALAEKYDGIVCEENYQDSLLESLDKDKFPCLTYTRDLSDWRHFIRRTPREYAQWVEGCNQECEVLELQILDGLKACGRPVFVDTNISIATLKQISDENHVLFLLAPPEISVNRFFDRPDREKQFLYRLLLQEPDPRAAMENFRACLSAVNSKERYEAFQNSGFAVLFRDETRTPEETLALAETILNLKERNAK